MIDRLTSMEAFVVAAEAGSYAGAALRLGMSAQMVAKHVAALELRLGARLLNRTTRRQSLTELGAAYYQRCKHILAEAGEADALAQVMSATPRGRLRIGAPVTFGSHSLMPFVTAFLRQYPEVEIDLHLTDRAVDLVEEGYEVVFRIGPIVNDSLIARPLAAYRLIACAAPSYIAERGIPRVPADLSAHDCLGYVYWSRPADNHWQFSQGAQTYSVSARSRLQVNETKALLSAALDGFGIVLGPADFLQPSLTAGHLVRLLPGYEGPTRPMHLLYRGDRQMTAKLRRFIDAAVAHFAET
jgi:DNA-binding transcriptional LysR family regulator